MRNRILRLFNIRSEESWLVINMFWLQFFQGAGVAIFNTVTSALFLSHFDELMLPKRLSEVYVFSGLLLLVFGFIYSKLEHTLPVKKLVPLVIGFTGLSIFVFHFTYSGTNTWFLFMIFGWYYIIYLLVNLEFWGLAALQFDTRQSKRLFIMVGAGEIPAKLIGYAIVPVLIKLFHLHVENVLIASGVSVLMALIFYYRLQFSGRLALHVHHEHERKRAETAATTNWLDIVKGFFGNGLIASVASLSFIVMTCVVIINFQFYSKIKVKAHNDEQLADWLALFYASGWLLAVFIRLILTGKLTNRLGTRGSLLISPVILFLFIIPIIFFTKSSSVLYIFGLMYLLTEVLKTSLQDPVFLTLMQPLSSGFRLKGHTVVKGVMDPFAYAFSGVLLFALVKNFGNVSLLQVSYLLIILLVIWVIVIFVVHGEYVKTLVTALDKRYTVGLDIDLSDEKTMEVLRSKISNSETGEAIYILNLIEKKYTNDQQDLVLMALKHTRPEVRLEAIKLAEHKKITAVLPVIEDIIKERTDTQILPEAVKAKCMLQPDELENLDIFVEDKDHRLMKSAITGLMTSGGINAVVTAGQRLLLLIPSANPAERKMAAEIIGELGVQSFYKPLLDLLKDENKEVLKAAIVASGKVKNERLISPLIRFFLLRQYERLVLNALHQAGDVSLKEIKQTLLHQRLLRQQQSKLILLCGRIGSENASGLLDELVWKLPSLRSDIFHALHLCEFKSKPHNREQHIALMNQYIASAISILFMILALENKDTCKVLVDALYIELNEIRDSLLLLFSFVYDKDKMMKAKSTFLLNKKESVANALEIIEIEVPKEISLKFIKIFEPASIDDKCASLKAYYKNNPFYPDIVDTVLNDKNYHFHRWTKAAALYSSIFYNGNEKRAWLRMAENEPDIMLREMAQKIMAEYVG